MSDTHSADSDLRSTLAEQRRTIEELQTPVIQVWDGVLALPVIGSVDTARAQGMTEALLEKIVETGSEIVAHAEWNALQPRQVRPADIALFDPDGGAAPKAKIGKDVAAFVSTSAGGRNRKP